MKNRGNGKKGYRLSNVCSTLFPEFQCSRSNETTHCQAHFLLNCTWSEDEVDKHLPAGIKRFIYENDIQFYTINATDLAEKIGLGNRINMIMQAAFFKLANVIELDKAIEYLKESIAQTYRKKGQAVVDMNCKAVDSGIGELNKVNVPESWKD